MTDPIREAFERWCKGKFVGAMARSGDGYCDPVTDNIWAAWKQSRREALMEAAFICDREGSLLASGHASVAAETARNCATLIRAAAEEEGK